MREKPARSSRDWPCRVGWARRGTGGIKGGDPAEAAAAGSRGRAGTGVSAGGDSGRFAKEEEEARLLEGPGSWRGDSCSRKHWHSHQGLSEWQGKESSSGFAREQGDFRGVAGGADGAGPELWAVSLEMGQSSAWPIWPIGDRKLRRESFEHGEAFGESRQGRAEVLGSLRQERRERGRGGYLLLRVHSH